MMPDEPIDDPRGSGPDGVPPTEDSHDALLPEDQPTDDQPADDQAAEDQPAEDRRDPVPPEEPPAGQERRLDELAFLERSLTDLDSEREAGDISDDDYRSLTRLYRERAAAVRRRGGGGGPGERTPRHWRRPLALLVIVAMLGTGVGVGLASALGHRSSSDTTTGDIRQSSRGMLFEAQELMATGHFDEAEELYAAVVAAEPSSAEALAWWGWLHFQRGDLEAAAERLGEAVAADPYYPDARVFGAIVAFRLGYLDAAAVHLDAFDAVDPPPLMVELVENSELRQRILAGRLVAAEAAGDSAATAALLAASTLDEMVVAAHHLAGDGEVLLAARLFDAVLAVDPANVAALVGRGALLTSPDFAAFEDVVAEGLQALDRAVELAPDNPEARFRRGLAAARQGRFDDALADLDHLLTLDAPAGLLTEAARLAEEVRAAAQSS